MLPAETTVTTAHPVRGFDCRQGPAEAFRDNTPQPGTDYALLWGDGLWNDSTDASLAEGAPATIETVSPILAASNVRHVTLAGSWHLHRYELLAVSDEGSCVQTVTHDTPRPHTVPSHCTHNLTSRLTHGQGCRLVRPHVPDVRPLCVDVDQKDP